MFLPQIWNTCIVILRLQCQKGSHLTFHGDISTFNTSPYANRSHKWLVFSWLSSKQFTISYTSRELWIEEDTLHKYVERISACRLGSLAIPKLRAQRSSSEHPDLSKPLVLLCWALYTHELCSSLPQSYKVIEFLSHMRKLMLNGLKQLALILPASMQSFHPNSHSDAAHHLLPPPRQWVTESIRNGSGFLAHCQINCPADPAKGSQRKL